MPDETLPHYASSTVRATNADAGDPTSRVDETDPQLDTTGDVASTTGDDVPSDAGWYVGRVAGQDTGYAGETGAERRAAAAEAETDEEGRTR